MGQVKWWLVIVEALIIGAIIITALYLMKVEPFYSFIPLIPSYISSSLSKLNLSSLITNNWATIAGFGLTIAPLAIAAVKIKMNEAATKKQLEAQVKLTELTKTDATTAILNAKSSASAEVTALREKLAQYEDDTTLTTLNQRISQLSSDNTALQTQVQSLTALKGGPTLDQIQELIVKSKRVP